MKPPLPETRAINRADTEAQKRKNDLEKETHTRKRQRKGEHQRENKERRNDGLPPLLTLESTPEPEGDDSDSAGDAPARTARSLSPTLPPPSPTVKAWDEPTHKSTRRQTARATSAGIGTP